ncbi:hypothetical protein DPMN_022642 [Dreissena polymorpha]|uniref:Uncharacterized protein n=1 Tax=Dreissena polymorpha TaxID=45954 RepID=A0A9D4SCJ2_DREPO|nr:hypothetical protein DPMN_022642 [Dreissena polymorpha]
MCARATKLGRIECPDGSRMRQVPARVSMPSFPMKVSPNVRSLAVVLAPLPHNRSLKSHLSLGVCVLERRTLADLCVTMGHACAKFKYASQCHRFR